MDRSKLFSKEALEKLQTPERLDVMLKVTMTEDWLMLVGVMLMLLSVGVWSVFGSFTTSVSGMGLITDYYGIVNVVHPSMGVVDELYVNVGSVVKKNDVIAVVRNWDSIANITMEYDNFNLSTNSYDARNRKHNYDGKLLQNIAETSIMASCDGVVSELMVTQGAFLSGNTPICSIRRTEGREDLTGKMYVPLENAKRIQKGMSVLIEPNTADAKESGKLLGLVTRISEYPVSPQGAAMQLGNSQLAGWIGEQKQSSLMEVSFQLLENDEDPSGYLWTSQVGEHRKITPGTFCKGDIVIESVPPIQRVFYKFSQWLKSR